MKQLVKDILLVMKFLWVVLGACVALIAAFIGFVIVVSYTNAWLVKVVPPEAWWVIWPVGIFLVVTTMGVLLVRVNREDNSKWAAGDVPSVPEEEDVDDRH